MSNNSSYLACRGVTPSLVVTTMTMMDHNDSDNDDNDNGDHPILLALSCFMLIVIIQWLCRATYGKKIDNMQFGGR